MKSTNVIFNRDRGSQNYIKTLHTKCAGDMLELETIRNVVKVINQENSYKESLTQYRFDNGYSVTQPTKLPRYYVKCQGRGPRTKYARAEGRHPRAYDRSIPLSIAEKMDVYVYQR